MAKLSDSNIYLRKNLIINGCMRMHQRDNSKGGLGNGDSGYPALDRWRFTEGGSPDSVWVMAQGATDPPPGTPFQNYMIFYPSTVETAIIAGELIAVEQRLEGQDLQHLEWGESTAKDIVLSFWTNSITKSGIMGVSLYHVDAADSYVHEVTITAGTWTKHELVFPGYTATAIADDNTEGLRLRFTFLSGTDFHGSAGSWTGANDYTTSNQDDFSDNTANRMHIAGVQLEVGSKATGFEWRPYATELKLCERYFETSYNTGVTVGTASSYGGSWGLTPCRSGTDYREDCRFRTRKRAAPTLIFYSPENGASGKIRNVTGATNVIFAITDIGETGACDHAWGSATVDGNRYQAHYTAEAEL